MIRNKRCNLHKSWSDERGFLTVDVLLLTVIIIGAVLSYALLGKVINAQQNGAYRITAVFLAQQYLNESEYDIVNGKIIGYGNTEEKISLNGQVFEIYARIDNINNIQQYRIAVEVRWRYENAIQSEYQERQIIAR